MGREVYVGEREGQRGAGERGSNARISGKALRKATINRLHTVALPMKF